MTELKRNPPHYMRKPVHPISSSLTVEMARPIYEKVGAMLAIATEPTFPGMFLISSPALYDARSRVFYRIQWMPELKDDWRRMTFAEFIEYYGIGGEVA